jgi:hypothetical protein
VTVPAGGPVGAEESTSLIATSGRRSTIWAIATDETVAVGALDPVIFLPDNSGVAPAGGTEAYGHRIINNTGVTDTFDLQGWSENGWDFAFHWDANADGVFTPGVDVEITNTLELVDGASQLIFLVTDVPEGTPDGTVDVVHLGAVARIPPDPLEPDQLPFGSATDTTTAAPPTELDLSGGGTRTVDPGETAVFPGTLRNLTDTDDTYDFTISAAWFWGFDGLDHPTELWVDTTGNGDPDTQIAEDLEGDGTWDNDNGFSLTPSYAVSANTILAYELRRPVHPDQRTSRDPVTLTALPQIANDEDSITATVLVAAPTAAVLSSFDAFSVDGQVVVEWRTSAEVGTIGFRLERRWRGEASFRQVHRDLIRGARGHLQGATYRLVDHGITVGDTATYRLTEVDAWGIGSVFGPFEVTVSKRARTDDDQKALAVGFSRTVNQSRIRTAAAPKVQATGELSGFVKIHVRESGMVWVSAEALAEAFGVGPATVSSWIADGSIWAGTGGAGGEPLPDKIFSDGFETGLWGPSAPAVALGPPEGPREVAWVAADNNSGLFFYGEVVDSIYTRDNVYWLQRGRGTTMPVRTGFVQGPVEIGSFMDELHIEQDHWPLTSVMTDPEADYWMWDYFFPLAGEPVVSKSFTIEAPGATGSGRAELAVHLQGSWTSEVSPNHQVEVSLNGTPLGGTWSWDDHDPLTLTVAFEQTLLVDGENTVEISALLADGLEFDEFYLDSFDLRYRRLHRADRNRLAATTTGDEVMTVEGFESDDITVFDISDPSRPVVLNEIRVTTGDSGFLVTFDTDGEIFPFYAATSSAAIMPAAIVADIASQLADPANAGRYVIVAGDGLEAEAALLADYRSLQGLSAVVARTADIYDEFNQGLKSPWAIHDFLRQAAETWAEPPEYVFLVGDGSLDHRGVWGEGEDLVPALMAVTDDGLVPSDNLMADWQGNDGVPEVSIGRLPAQSAAELAVYRDKVIEFEAGSGEWKRQALWLADAADSGGEFSDDLQALVEGMPEGYNNQRIMVDRLGAAAARQQTLESWNDGAAMVHFLGHGAIDFIANSGLLETGDVAGMTNGERAPMLSALTCMVGRFDIPSYDILSEALVHKDGGGAIGVWSPSAFSMNADAALLGGYQIEALASGDHQTIGDSVREALAAYAASGHGDPAVQRIFILLGDPATRIDW